MRLAIISDSHYPWKLTKLTILASQYGYTEQFYINLEQFYHNITDYNVDTLIFNGDFSWDIFSLPFSNKVLEKIDPMWYFYPFIQASIVRDLVKEQIPILYIQGNHDYWFDLTQNPIRNGIGELHLHVAKFTQYLSQYALSQSKIAQIIEKLLDFFKDAPLVADSTLKLENNIILLRNSGIKIGNILLYGMPWYEKKNPSKPWINYKEDLVNSYHSFIHANQDGINPYKIVVLHHRNPPTMKFIQELGTNNLLAFVYGHWHGMQDFVIEKYKSYGPYICVLPEKNQFKAVLLDV